MMILLAILCIKLLTNKIIIWYIKPQDRFPYTVVSHVRVSDLMIITLRCIRCSVIQFHGAVLWTSSTCDVEASTKPRSHPFWQPCNQLSGTCQMEPYRSPCSGGIHFFRSSFESWAPHMPSGDANQFFSWYKIKEHGKSILHSSQE